jgi:hypothetical protein
MAVTQQVESTMWSRSAKFPEWVDNIEVTADTAVNYTVPAKVAAVLITPLAPVWMAIGTDAAGAPTGTSTDGSGSIYVSGPSWWRVGAGTVLSFYSLDGTYVGVGCYAAP